MTKKDEPPDTLDGKYSIEQEVDILINDLVVVQPNSPGDSSVGNTLESLRYLVDYRLANCRHRLDKELMRRLALALLEHTGKREGYSFAHKRLCTKEADEALCIFTLFMSRVGEFWEAAGEVMGLMELRAKLNIHVRFYDGVDVEVKKMAVDCLRLLSQHPHLDVADLLIKPDILGDLKEVLLSNEDQISDRIPEDLLPPQGLYSDRRPERVLDMFRVTISSGLTIDEVKRRRGIYGPNVIPRPPDHPLWKIIFGQINDFMIWLLLAAAALSVFIEPDDLVSPIVLVVVVIVNVSIGMAQELRARKALKALEIKLEQPMAKCRRDGLDCLVPSSELVPGDIVFLQEGDAVPADLRLIATKRFETVEQALTGESVPVAKQSAAIKIRSRRLNIQKTTNCAFMSSQVARGTCTGLVCRTGLKTEMGLISAALTVEDGDLKTRLQEELADLGKVLVMLAVALCLVIILLSVFVRQDSWNHALRYGLNLAVSVIPEGLVAVVTVSMAISVARMAERGAVVKRMAAVECVGAVSVICTDKTGTLTVGKMQVEQTEAIQPEYLKDCYRITALCNNAVVIDGMASGTDTTEVALLEAAMQNGLDKTNLLLTVKKMIEIPFDSDRKMMSVLLWHLGGDEAKPGELLSKGAPEVILKKCHISEKSMEAIMTQQVKWAEKGWRVLALARANIQTPQEEIEKLFAENEDYDLVACELERNLEFVGLIALSDPPRAGIADAVAACHRAGIQVVMITGDHPDTATAIARQIGIDGNQVMRGREVDILGEDGVTKLPAFPSIFARVSPENKLTIVKALQARGNVTVMTGDGVNDAPAIRRADVGVAMGLSGTDLAKHAADLTLSDDNFSTIMEAVKEGRRVYDNISKFVVYLLACNSAEIWMVLLALLFRKPPPLASTHILFANIIADIPPSTALGCEEAEPDVMTKGPRPKDARLLSSWNAAMIVVYGLAIAGMSLFPYLFFFNDRNLTKLRSEAFVSVTVLQLVLAFLCRSLTRPIYFSGNFYLILAVMISMSAMLLGCYVPVLNDALELQPVPLMGWVRILASSFALIVVSEILKLVKRTSRSLV